MTLEQRQILNELATFAPRIATGIRDFTAAPAEFEEIEEYLTNSAVNTWTSTIKGRTVVYADLGDGVIVQWQHRTYDATGRGHIVEDYYIKVTIKRI